MTCVPKTSRDVVLLFESAGGMRYDGEPVTHLEHALQAATLARRAGACDALIAAALLHDTGHLAAGLPGTPSAIGIDDHHEDVGARLLAGLFPSEVCEPIRLHVQAKRHLAAQPAYSKVLSADSLRSLALQGGPMTATESRAFVATPFSEAAIRVRRWDDAAKLPRADTDSFDTLWALVERVAERHRRG